MMKRRDFLLTSGSTITTWSLSSLVNAAICTDIPVPAIRNFRQQDWLTIAGVQNHLFPSEEHAPGAVEINALRYLHNYLANPLTDPHEISFIHSGTRLLQEFSRQQQTGPFNQLSIDERENILRLFEKQADGRRWLITILNYILESLLTDPVYGGNPQGIGWKWLQHRAGEPRPPANKRYWLL